MGRTIDADKLMDWFKEHNPFDEFPAEYICKIINEQPTVQPQTKCIAKITLNKEQIQDAVEKAKREILAVLPRWIPVTERLPEAEKRVLVDATYENHCFICVGSYCEDDFSGNGHWEDDDGYRINGHALMDLPEPYKRGEQND